MEEVVQYFIQELRKAGNNLVKLSVVTALHESFLTKAPSCKASASIGDLIKCLLKILEDQFGVDEDGNLGTSGSSQCRIENTTVDLLKLMTLRCVYEFSQDRSNVFELDMSLRKSVLSFLAGICDLEQNRFATDRYRFTPNFTKCVKKYIHSMDCKFKVRIISEQNDAHCNLSTLKRHLELYEETETAKYIWQIIDSAQFELCGLSIVSESSGQDNDRDGRGELVDLLVSQQVAWARGHKFKAGHSEKDKEGKIAKHSKTSETDVKSKDGKSKTYVCDSVMRNILNGNLLWVNIGEDSIDSVERIHSTLKQKFESDSMGRCRFCKQNGIVAALVDGTDMQWSLGIQQRRVMVRGKILSVISGLVTVFGVDIGGVFKVPLSSVFYLPPELCITVIPQQATLAYLHDILPIPVDYSHVELPVAIMAYFCRTSDTASAFVDLSLLPILPALIACGDSVIVGQALRLSTVISKFVTVDFSNDWCRVLFSVLECLNNLVQNFITASDDQRQRVASQSTILNEERSSGKEVISSPAKSPNLKRASPQQTMSPGSDNACSPVREKLKHKDDKSVKGRAGSRDEHVICACLRLLSNLLHKNQPMKEVFYHQSGLETVIICERIFGMRHFVSSSIQRLMFNFVNTYSNSTGFHAGRRGQVSLMGNASDDEDNDDSNDDFDENVDLDLSSSEEDEDSGLGSALYPDTSSPCSDESEKESNFLIRGSIYPHVANPRYELLEGLDWTSQSLCAIVCGMLNSGQVGTICVGAAKGGKVRGETVSHHMRDELRLGMDNLMARLVPNMMHFQLQVRFVPVVDRVAQLEDPGSIQLHVIEIVCNPMRGTIHSLKNGKAYYRTGSKTIQVNEQDIRQLIVIDEEKSFMDEILDLQYKLQILTSDETS